MKFTKNEGEITGAKGHFQKFFILEPQASYGFHVEVKPDRSVDLTTLKVQEGTRTRQSVPIIHITQGEIDAQ
ncbi:MAG: hypothetical protein AB4058_15755 [Microcystaceae cyanobacterium]